MSRLNFDIRAAERPHLYDPREAIPAAFPVRMDRGGRYSGDFRRYLFPLKE